MLLLFKNTGWGSVFSLFLALFCANVSVAQEIQISEDAAVGKLFQTWVRTNRATSRIAGWRVQLLSTTDRALAEERKTRFRLQFPDVVADWVHEKPYYKLRAGAFLTRPEAQAFAASIRDAWPGAYPAKDLAIHPRDFLQD